MDSNVIDLIKDAEVVLVGIGEEFAPDYPEFGDEIIPYFNKSSYCAKLPKQHRVFQAYDALRELLRGKPYFIVNMNDDGLIYRSELPEDFIVSPCGNIQKMQCEEHIVDAEEVRKQMLIHPDAENVLCPICQKRVQFHTVSLPGYLENGYLKQWEKYRNFLQGTLNHKLCILELGVGFRFPQVIRLPFEKTVFYNKKASLVRVNQKFPQLPEEILERGISLNQDPIQWILDKQF